MKNILRAASALAIAAVVTFAATSMQVKTLKPIDIQTDSSTTFPAKYKVARTFYVEKVPSVIVRTFYVEKTPSMTGESKEFTESMKLLAAQF